MPRRCTDISAEKQSNGKSGGGTNEGEILTDLRGKQWKLGKTIGNGGFGEIYLASEDLNRDVKTDTSYVAKLEKHSNGPLFVEINCYLRIAKDSMIKKWKKERHLEHLGMPHYVASGSHVVDDEKYRFLILPQCENDIDNILQSNKTFNLKTVLSISYQITDVLEYIHSHGYVHSDIKASNIMLEISNKTDSNKNKKVTRRREPIYVTYVKAKAGRTRAKNLRQIQVVNYNDDLPDFDYFVDLLGKTSSPKNSNQVNCDKIYLLDYGLASKYVSSDGSHREFCTDERKAHAGTVLFCSRDAHKGVASRRSDMESLGYNMIYWLTGNLPWADGTDDPAKVERRKTRCMSDINNFLNYCFNGDVPKFLMEYFNYVNELQYEECPNYDYCRCLFKQAISENGFKDNLKLDFDNLEKSVKKVKKIKNRGRENIKPRILISMGPPRHPLISSNVFFKKPKLRKKTKSEADGSSMLNWSKILIDDPEDIVRAARERKNTDGNDSGGVNVLDMDLDSMNPTPAMLEVFNRCKERTDVSPKYKGDSSVDHIEGYTPAMMNVYIRKLEREMLESEHIALLHNNNKRSKNGKGSSKKTRYSKKPAEQPTTIRRSSRSQAVSVSNKKVVKAKKTKSVPIRRMYSLRG